MTIGRKTGSALIFSRDDIFDFIVKYKKEHGGLSPSLKNIAEAIGIASVSTVNASLEVLRKQGRIYFDEEIEIRNIRIPGENWSVNNDN
jgi:SOS-response transcriptional repressor LexA